MRTERLSKLKAASPAVLPSLLQCDFGNLRNVVERLETAGIQALHLDVMDGHFVPNLTYGMPIVAALRRLTDMPLDVHLMISDPAAYVDAFVDAGADMLTFHIEAVEDPSPVIEHIQRRGVAAGVALNPDTPLSSLDRCLDQVDAVLVMSVKAGFGGQSFHSNAIDRLQQLRQARPELLLEIDGGIKTTNIGACRRADCDLFVVGSAIFGHDDYETAVRELVDAL